MYVNEYFGFKVGDTVKPKIGPWQGKLCVIDKIEESEGAKNGWFTCVAPNGSHLYFAGEELEKWRYSLKR